MTATFFNTVRKVSLVLALTTSFAAVSSTASFAFSSEAQQMCTGDAFRLCSSEIPNNAPFDGSESACVDATQALFVSFTGRAVGPFHPFTNACGRDFGALDSCFDAFS